jgi:hypothetical protein
MENFTFQLQNFSQTACPWVRLKKSSSVTGLEWPRGFQEVKIPRFHDNGRGCQPYELAAFTPRK